jgi:hypothetical protein
MSTIKTTFIQHPSSDEPNIQLNADGTVDLPLSNIEDLANVSVESPEDGDVLLYDDGDWVSSRPPARVINTDDEPGYTIYIGSVDPSIDYTLESGDIWIEVPS